MPSASSIIFESGLAGPPEAWFPVAQLLAPEFRTVIHRRAGPETLPRLARQLRTALNAARIPAPYVLVAHSFGGLVARQFSVSFPKDTAGLVLVDALPPQTSLTIRKLWRYIALARAAQAMAALGLLKLMSRLALRRFQPLAWAPAEFRKLPPPFFAGVWREWHTVRFHQSLAGQLSLLPRNLRLARTLTIPKGIPVLALHSDYPDPEGRRIENSGHWIQIDRPDAVAQAVRDIIERKGV